MTKEVIAIPRETFDLMQMALEGINHLDADINFLNTNELEEMMDKALSAAKAVGEPTIKESFTVAEQSAELDAGMAAQHYCRGLWGFYGFGHLVGALCASSWFLLALL